MNKILLLLCSVVIFSSCSDDSSTNPSNTNKSFLMTRVGSYWIYESTVIPDGLPTKTFLDSLNLDAESSVGSYSIYNCTMHSDTNNNGSYEENISNSFNFILEDNKLYLTRETFMTNFINLYGSFEIKTGLNWNDDKVKIADNKLDEWTIISQMAQIDLPNHSVSVDGTISVTVTKIDSTKKLQINDIEYELYGFKIKFDIKGQGERKGFTNPFFSTTYGMETVFWLADGIGPVLIEKGKLAYSTTNSSVSYPVIDAKNSVLIRYSSTD